MLRSVDQLKGAIDQSSAYQNADREMVNLISPGRVLEEHFSHWATRVGWQPCKNKFLMRRIMQEL